MGTILRNKKARIVIGFILAIVILAGYIYIMVFSSPQEMKKSICLVEYQTYHTLLIDGKEKLFFKEISKDSLFISYTTEPDSISAKSQYTIGCWINKYPTLPSCFGRMVTILPHTAFKQTLSEKTLRGIVKKNLPIMESKKRLLRHKISETNYYLKVHGVEDEGYSNVAKYEIRLKGELAEIEKVLLTLKSIHEKSSISIQYHSQYNAILKGEKVRMAVSNINRNKSAILLQTQDKNTPKDIHAISVLPWDIIPNNDVFAASYTGLSLAITPPSQDTADIVSGRIQKGNAHTFPPLLIADGSPLFTNHGNFIGTVRGKNILTRKEVYALIQAK